MIYELNTSEDMKEIISRMCRWTLAMLGVSGVTACNESGGGFHDYPVMYGTPYCSYEVKCRVIDSETKTPVKGVRLVTGLPDSFTLDDNGNIVKEFSPWDEAVEKGDGGYLMTGSMAMGESIAVKLEDLDPSAEGHYRDTIYVIPLEKIKESENGAWDMGTYGADVTVEAKQIKQ